MIKKSCRSGKSENQPNPRRTRARVGKLYIKKIDEPNTFGGITARSTLAKIKKNLR